MASLNNHNSWSRWKNLKFCNTLSLTLQNTAHMTEDNNLNKFAQNITRDIEVKNSLTIARGEGGRDSGEKGFQELLTLKGT